MPTADLPMRLAPDRIAGLLIVLAIHAAALWGLWQHRLLPAPAEVATLFVNFIAPPAPKPKEKPKPRQIVAETPVVAPTDYVAPPEPAPAPVIEAPTGSARASSPCCCCSRWRAGI